MPRKRLIRYGLLSANIVILLGVSLFVIHTSSSSVNTTQGYIGSGSTIANPLDQLSSADIAVNVARMTGIYEQQAVVNNADTISAELSVASADDTLISKPQVVATSAKTRYDIKSYITKSGDTISGLAAHFGVTSNTIKWSNNLTSNTLPAGKKLLISPIDGIVYTVKKGDTPTSLATKYSANANAIISFNDAELNGLQPGERIVIPNGKKPAPVYSYSYYAGYAWGGSAIYGYNGYDFGNCTWYVATQIAVPANWGNASTWALYASRTPGWVVSSSPVVGAIAQTPYAAGGYGHVAIVDAVKSVGGMTYIKYRDMNNYGDGGGFDRVGHSGWTPSSLFPHYIYH